jgi:uncharacterized membrane protein YdbT with pleckstrin-like domain
LAKFSKFFVKIVLKREHMPSENPLAPTPYVKKILMSDEFVVYQGRLHWCTLIKSSLFAAFMFLVAALPIILEPKTPSPFFAWAYSGWASAFLVAVGAISLLDAVLRRKTCEIAVTNVRVILKKGIIHRTAIEARLDSLDSIGVDQGLFGRLVDCGTIAIRGITSSHEFNFVAGPFGLKRAVEEEIQKMQPGARLGATRQIF